jgi:hypothetical protein
LCHCLYWKGLTLRAGVIEIRLRTVVSYPCPGFRHFLSLTPEGVLLLTWEGHALMSHSSSEAEEMATELIHMLTTDANGSKDLPVTVLLQSWSPPMWSLLSGRRGFFLSTLFRCHSAAFRRALSVESTGCSKAPNLAALQELLKKVRTTGFFVSLHLPSRCLSFSASFCVRCQPDALPAWSKSERHR